MSEAKTPAKHVTTASVGVNVCRRLTIALAAAAAVFARKIGVRLALE